jgi:serine/threonine-protein kinase
MLRRPLLYFITIVVGSSVLLATWAGLRTNLESRMAAAARRGMETIVDLVAAELSHQAHAREGVHGEPLLRDLLGSRPDFAAVLRIAEDSHFRRVYFFDAQGSALRIEFKVETIPDTDIVRRARVALGDRADHGQGALLDPYLDSWRQDVIGVWRWLPDARLGIVAERPYARFAQPLRWFDAAFAGFAIFLTIATIILMRRHSWLIESTGEPKRCGPYDILRRLGDGSMGHVYLARHRNLRRIVALKRLKPHAQSDEINARFEREARLASQLSHPNIVMVLDHGRAPGGGFYYTMEYIPGLTLTQWVERHGALSPERAIYLMRQICAALSTMHARQLLHRDIKPDNIMAYAAHGDYDRVKLLDFGLIKDYDHDTSRDLTRDVRILGTPAFMAPERLIDPGRIDPRSDLYGIACVGFYLLTGRKPFEATQETDLTQQVLHIEAPRISGLVARPLPDGLDTLLAEALAKDPARRPASVALFRERLDSIAAQCRWDREAAKYWWQAIESYDSTVPKEEERASRRLDVSFTSP